MGVRIVSGSANRPLATAIATTLGVELAPCELERFPDGELRPKVAELEGEDVYLVQPTSPPVDEHLVELLLLVDACRRAEAGRITCVVPYFGYARQDRRTEAGQALGARVVADALHAVGADRLVVVDPHTPALEAMCALPVVALTAVPHIADAVSGLVEDDAVIVAPDLGAVKLAERYASRLHRPVAVVRKTRLSGSAVVAHEIAGDVTDRPVLIVDDMISTGATTEAAISACQRHGAAGDVVVAATHGPLVPSAVDRLSTPAVRHVAVTDTLSVAPSAKVDVVPVAALLADAIGRLHGHRAIDDLLVRA